MSRNLLLGLISVCLFGQGNPDLFTKAPPAVEDALRARVTAFFEAQQAGKFRQADQYVAEDSKDAYYAAEKPNCKAWKLERFVWEQEFTKARAFITCDTSLMTITGPLKVKMPLTSHWRVVDGQWYWYLPPQPAVRQTPFGEFRPGPEPKGPAPAGLPARLPTLEEILSQLQLSRNQVRFERGRQGREEILFTNGSPGPVKLAIDTEPAAGVKATIEKQDLNGGESTKIIFTYTPGPVRLPDEITVALRVDPFTQSMPIKLSFR